MIMWQLFQAVVIRRAASRRNDSVQ